MYVMLTVMYLTVLPVSATDDEALTEHPTIIAMHEEAQKQRKKYNRAELKLDEECCKMAQKWANYMATNSKFHHDKNDQIIARGYKSVKSVFRGWMNSGGHRAWILNNKSTKCGWGCQRSKGGMLYWVGVFR